MRQLPTRWRAALAALACALVAIGIIDPLGDGARRSEPAPRSPAPAAASTPTPTPAPPAGELQTTDPEALRDDTPAGVPAAVLDQAEDEEREDAQLLPAVTNPLPVGGAQGYECRVDIARDGSGNPRGWGSRAPGSKVMSFKLHYTAGPNSPGWGDVIGTGDYLERVGLSAHLIVDFEGHCLQKVPWAGNAYTQGAFNSTSESVEIIATGRETRAQWLASPLIKDGILAAIVRDRLRARGLPARRVDPVGCVDELGVTDHNALECRNNHTDVAPAFPWDVFMRQLRDGPRSVTHTDRVTCRRLNWYRARRQHPPRPSAQSRRRAIRRRDALKARGVTCTASGPVRR